MALLILAGCGAEAGAAASDAERAKSSILVDNFESYPLGPLGNPWIITVNSGASSASKASIVSTSDHGKVLLLRGSKTVPDFLIASRGFSSSTPDLSVEVDIKPATGASFIWSVHGTGPSIGSRRIRLQREPGSNTLVAHTVPSGSTPCATLASNVWSRIRLIIHTQQYPHTFDVLINNQSTNCTRISTRLSHPFSHVNVMDASNENWGGDVRFDNIVVSAPYAVSVGSGFIRSGSTFDGRATGDEIEPQPPASGVRRVQNSGDEATVGVESASKTTIGWKP